MAPKKIKKKQYSLAIDAALTIRSVVTALHRTVVVGHRVQVVQGVPRTVQTELPHV